MPVPGMPGPKCPHRRLRCSTSRTPCAIAKVYIEILRGTSALIQLFYLFFAFRRIILPQAFATMLAPFGNLLAELLKPT